MIGSRARAWSNPGRRLGRAAAAALGCLTLVGLALPGCGSEEAKCEGVQTPWGCQQRCVESACSAPGMKCVANTCAQPCVDHAKDCPAGKWCYSTQTDDGVAGQYCMWAPFSKGGKYLGQYDTQCTSDDQCDGMRGYKCLSGVCKRTGCTLNADCADVPGTCVRDPGNDPAKSYCEKGRLALGPGEACAKSAECDSDVKLACVNGVCAFTGCRSHEDCATIGECKAGKTAEGQDVLACVKGKTYPAGQFGTKCPGGASAKECDESNGFVCIGAGPGDIDAYCSKASCLADSDCAPGYFCATTRTSKKPCTDVCNMKGAAGTGCVAASDIGPGKEYSCGPVSLLRKICLKRDFCKDCQTDDDCRALPNQVCASDGKGHRYCTELCDPNQSNACSWGSAAECAVHDTALGKPTCAHKFGACSGTGKSCEPCRDDADCPAGFCSRSDYSGESFCVDLGPSCDCTGFPTSQNTVCLDGGCPKTPGNSVMMCYGGPAVPATSVLANKCYGADSMQGTKWPYTRPGCWPE